MTEPMNGRTVYQAQKRKVMLKFVFAFSYLLFSLSCSSNNQPVEASKVFSEPMAEKVEAQEGEAVAYFASGCFWCVEEVFEAVVGVREAVSGYSGGKASDANYSDVSAGRTNHAEAVQVFYDPKLVSYEELLNVFFLSHDPTTLNRQGPDRGRQYRSAIFFQSKEEEKLVHAKVSQLRADNVFDGDITTEIVKLDAFYAAEDYHQNYVIRNPNNGYVKSVSKPRYNRFIAKYEGKLKDH